MYAPVNFLKTKFEEALPLIPGFYNRCKSHCYKRRLQIVVILRHAFVVKNVGSVNRYKVGVIFLRRLEFIFRVCFFLTMRRCWRYISHLGIGGSLRFVVLIQRVFTCLIPSYRREFVLLRFFLLYCLIKVIPTGCCRSCSFGSLSTTVRVFFLRFSFNFVCTGYLNTLRWFSCIEQLADSIEHPHNQIALFLFCRLGNGNFHRNRVLRRRFPYFFIMPVKEIRSNFHQLREVLFYRIQ